MQLYSMTPRLRSQHITVCLYNDGHVRIVLLNQNMLNSALNPDAAADRMVSRTDHKGYSAY